MMRLLDVYADVLPYGLQPTPFGEVWRALQAVASTVWDVDPAVYRAGIAWGWYVQRNPDALVTQRDLVVAALISEQAPLIKADQTTAELVEYLRQWRKYRPTYDRLEAIYKLFAADVEILPISTPGAPPVSDTRLAFYVRIYGVDFSRMLTLDEAYTIAIRATPLGSRPIVYYEFEEQLSVDTQPLKAGIASINYENDAVCEPAIVTYTLSFVNTQLPDITITMPPNETGPSGTVVTLPTMSGEYESGGKTWTPSTWDIGAFGSSYTITADTIAHLVFVEVPAYTFIISDAVTGEILAKFSEELIVEPLGNVIMQDESIIIGIPHTVPIQTFWFTANGQNEQDNSLLPSFGYDIDLYNADGTRASGAQYDGAYPLTYMKSDGNMFASGDDRIIINGGVDLLGLESDEENNRSAWSVQVEKLSE